MPKIKWIIVYLLLMTVVSCTQEFTPTYLIQHPLQLKRELDQCQNDKEQSKEREAYCLRVNAAASTFASLINNMQQNPEKFGQEIINAQIAMAKTEQQIIQAKQRLKTASASTTEYDQAKQAVELAEKEFAEEQDKVKAMLAVVGMSSPE